MSGGLIGVIGAGAFGTALAVVLAREGRAVALYARDGAQVAAMRATRRNDSRLAGVDLPPGLAVTDDLVALDAAETLLLTVPTQKLGAFLAGQAVRLDGRRLVACCKGVDLATLDGPVAMIARACPVAVPAVLTGPSFAADIARGLPTALTLACADDAVGRAMQHQLSTATLRLYRTPDTLGAELGGALKNVVAIAAGVAIGAGLGDSARAALMTRGYAEMLRLAVHLGAQGETLAGLSGFGDLVLTCTSAQSRNFRYGQSLGAGQGFDPAVTVEGAATARAVTRLAAERGIDMPIAAMVAALIEGRIALSDAVTALLSRPLKQE
ncbi:MAG: NAD(P)H-dependent glycerol-3-phosphate dehydrogenase [Paracoccaceae bacterium]